MQDKKKSAIESIINTVAGLVVSLIIQSIIYPLLNIPVTVGQNLLITSVFFVASFVRNYVVRRLFTGERTLKPVEKPTKPKTIRVLMEDVRSTDLIVSEFEGESVTFNLTAKSKPLHKLTERRYWKQMVRTNITHKECMFYAESYQWMNVIRS